MEKSYFSCFCQLINSKGENITKCVSASHRKMYGILFCDQESCAETRWTVLIETAKVLKIVMIISTTRE